MPRATWQVARPLPLQTSRAASEHPREGAGRGGEGSSSSRYLLSVIVDIVDLVDIDANETKSHAPVPIDPDRPVASKFSLQGMQPVRRDAEIGRARGGIESAENAFELRPVRRLDAPRRPVPIESLEPFVPEPGDHAALYRVTAHAAT